MGGVSSGRQEVHLPPPEAKANKKNKLDIIAYNNSFITLPRLIKAYKGFISLIMPYKACKAFVSLVKAYKAFTSLYPNE